MRVHRFRLDQDGTLCTTCETLSRARDSFREMLNACQQSATRIRVARESIERSDELINRIASVWTAPARAGHREDVSIVIE